MHQPYDDVNEEAQILASRMRRIHLFIQTVPELPPFSKLKMPPHIKWTPSSVSKRISPHMNAKEGKIKK